ncbi:MAG: sigma-54-dependent Fis family transcriptional regulator [Planctomycetes bacterium]|nr:sigma-54-dependent Fis family transcriptional regulator [Planctomycetota bacterium]
MSMGKVLVAEDNASMRDVLVMALEASGYEVSAAENGEEALARLKGEPFDLVVSDLKMPKLDGMGLLRASREVRQPPAFIMITAHGSIAEAVEATNLGAVDFIEKPFDLEKLEFIVAEAIGAHAPVGSGASPLEGVIGSSAALLEAADIIQRVADSQLPVLIVGETGTGKQVHARALHEIGSRKGEFVRLDCERSANEPLESLLFGVDGKGGEAGALEKARDGTLFLDAVDRLPLGLQSRLLRYLQDKCFEREGGTKSLTSNARVVAATDRDLHALVQAQAFREDLYYSINAVTVSLPSLRDHMEDFASLLAYFTERANREHNRHVAFSPRAETVLRAYDWPGNVLELKNVVERCVVIAAGDVVSESEIPEHVRNPLARGSRASLSNEMEDIEKRRLVDALEKHQWNQTRAARALRIGRTSLQYKMKKYGLTKSR